MENELISSLVSTGKSSLVVSTPDSVNKVSVFFLSQADVNTVLAELGAASGAAAHASLAGNLEAIVSIIKALLPVAEGIASIFLQAGDQGMFTTVLGSVNTIAQMGSQPLPTASAAVATDSQQIRA